MGPIIRTLFDVMARPHLLLILLAGFLFGAPVGARAQLDRDCVAPRWGFDVILPNDDPFNLVRIDALFRFHRQREALSELDAARAIARGPWRWRVPFDRRGEIVSRLDTARDCLANAKPPALATLRLRVLNVPTGDDEKPAPRAGARVHVEGFEMGRTGRDGTLTVRVPSGPIRVDVDFQLVFGAYLDLSLTPGQSEMVEVKLSDGREGGDDASLVLVESIDDIVPSTSKSLTLRLMKDGRLAPVTGIESIDVEDRNGNLVGDLRKFFSVVDGEMVASNAQPVFKELALRFGETIFLQVMANGPGEHTLYNARYAFRVGQSPLSVTLAPPLSHSAVPLSNIEVGITLVGSGVAVQRMSDAKGRLTVDSFPHGTVALECVTIANGKYYYGQATLVHSAAGTATLVLRHVDDLKAGAATATLARLTVASAEKDRTIEASTTLTVPRGTKEVVLAYEAKSVEERRVQPGVDDVWSLSVLGEDGRRLFHVMRNVSSQDHVNPHWQTGKTTGRLQEIFDVATMAAQADVRLTLVATAVNIGDGLYPTSVEAVLGATL
jgi:hypothetical protein